MKYVKYILFTLNIVFANCNCRERIINTSNSNREIDSQKTTVLRKIIPKDKFKKFKYPHSSLRLWESVKDDDEINYITDSLGLLEMYNNAKWLTYCMYCFDTFYFTPYAVSKHSVKDSTPASEIDLQLIMISMSNIEFNYKKKVVLGDYQLTIGPKNIPWRHDSIYKKYKNDILYYKKYMNICIFYSFNQQNKPLGFEANSRIYELSQIIGPECQYKWAQKILLNPFQPEIIKHVRENSSHIHPWFLNEAKKRGMFDSVKYTPAWVEKEILLNKQKPKNCDEETIRTR